MQQMDYETFITSLFQLLKSSENLYFVCYALLTCLFTQIAKKLFVSKVKVDVLHKFDLAVVLPFVFGGMFAVLDMVVIKHVRPVTFTVVLQMAVSTATIGALASVMFKLISSLGGKNLHTLLKDDAFGIFYPTAVLRNNKGKSCKQTAVYGGFYFPSQATFPKCASHLPRGRNVQRKVHCPVPTFARSGG